MRWGQSVKVIACNLLVDMKFQTGVSLSNNHDQLLIVREYSNC